MVVSGDFINAIGTVFPIALCGCSSFSLNATPASLCAPDGQFLPATLVTCPAFAGTELKTLAITSAADGLETPTLTHG
jgi:hypothetical protein